MTYDLQDFKQPPLRCVYIFIYLFIYLFIYYGILITLTYNYNFITAAE